MNKLVCGWGVNDADYQIQISIPNPAGGTMKGATRIDCPYYRAWGRMVERCHSGRFPAYAGTVICEEWRYFMAFRSWMDQQPWAGNELDKDILGDGTLYSPATCCFVPRSVNMFWNKSSRSGHGLPGASYRKSSRRYMAQCAVGGRNVALGYFDTELDAHRAWVAAKEEAMAILLDSVHLEPRVVEGMHRKLKQFQARFAA